MCIFFYYLVFSAYWTSVHIKESNQLHYCVHVRLHTYVLMYAGCASCIDHSDVGTERKWTRALIFYKASNSSILCLVLPWRICRRVLYLSRPTRTFSVCNRSFCVFLVSSRAWDNSEVRACKEDNISDLVMILWSVTEESDKSWIHVISQKRT